MLVHGADTVCQEPEHGITYGPLCHRREVPGSGLQLVLWMELLTMSAGYAYSADLLNKIICAQSSGRESVVPDGLRNFAFCG